MLLYHSNAVDLFIIYFISALAVAHAFHHSAGPGWVMLLDCRRFVSVIPARDALDYLYYSTCEAVIIEMPSIRFLYLTLCCCACFLLQGDLDRFLNTETVEEVAFAAAQKVSL